MNIEDIKKFLINSRKLKREATSYIIYGGKKEEREDIAIFFSSLINCDNYACGKCDDCKKVKKRIHPDVKWIIPEKSLLSIDDVRWVKEDIVVKPYSGKEKIYIFQINYMREEAANSFLKILEEPPSYSNILILSESINFFLPTIVSRCHRLKLNYQLPEYDEEMKMAEKEFSELINAFKKGNYYSFFKHVDNFVKDKEREEIEFFIEKVSIFLRDIYFRKMNFHNSLLINKNTSLNVFKDIDSEKIEKVIEIKNRIKYNINIKLAIENLIFHLFHE